MKPNPNKFPSEYNHRESKEEYVAEKLLGFMGRYLGSKGRYRFSNPSHLVVFNANICTSVEKIWHGDIDLTLDHSKLTELAKTLKRTIFVLSETDGRFENEKSPKIENAIATFKPEGFSLRDAEFYYTDKENNPRTITDEEYRKRHPIQPSPSMYEDKGEEFTLFKMPSVEEFKSKSKKESPIDKLNKYFISRYKTVEKASKVFRNIYWTKEYEDQFNAYLVYWASKVMKYDDYEVKKAVSWATFDLPMGLSSGGLNPTWAKPGKVYLRKRKDDEV